ncbi:MAG TPA: GAP family protein [Streptosporangiaceae bacterium]|nr:GAP family protein [Streptosporangiaceae bacterium]
MLIQAAGLALLAALSPTALLVAAVYLGSSRPRLVTAFYLAGAAAMSLVMAVALLAILRGVNLQRPAEHTPRYGLRLVLGILLLAAAVVAARRKARPPDPAKANQGFLSKMVADPAPTSAFLVGILVFAPGVSFLAAVQVIATARASLDLTVLALIIVVVINVLLVWVPIVVHLVAPEATTRRLTAFNGWLRAHGKLILTCVLVAVGGFMVINGIYGLAVVR